MCTALSKCLLYIVVLFRISIKIKIVYNLGLFCYKNIEIHIIDNYLKNVYYINTSEERILTWYLVVLYSYLDFYPLL